MIRVAGLILRLVFNRWVLLAIVLVAIGLVIWLVGPTISINNFHPFEEEWVRWLQIAFLILIPAVKWTWGTIKARRANAALTKGLLEPVPARVEARPDQSAEELARLRQRLEQAMALLRKLRFGTERPSVWARARSLGSQQHLYDLPWYVFIGAPGAGKTTALINSGLRFPLADRLGREAVRGVGGTRDCDWWFTDEAVFLDTAGRYTTQESNPDVDAGAWKGFLHLLKKSRPRRPINGLLVTVSVDDLLAQSPAEREAHTQALRTRVQELYAELGVRFPIYVLVTKSDLLAGFTEFFASLGREERAQVWGFSLPLGDQALDPPAMTAELERLEQRLFDRLPERLEEERDPTRRALVYGFPEQFALLRDRLVAFVDATFAPSKFEVTPLLRGVYFTSGTQEGSPIDRVMGAVAREFGLGRMLLPPQQPSGRSYFLTRLLREIVFPEAGLAGLDLRWERRRRSLQRGAIAAAVATLVLATTAWWISYTHNRAYLKEATAQFDKVKAQVAAVPTRGKIDLFALLPILTSVDDLSRTAPDGSVPWSRRFGLDQSDKLDAASEDAYQRMLKDTFLPSLAVYLERYLDWGPATAEDTYEALRTYVMLYDPKHFKRETAWRWYEAHRKELLPGADADAQKALKAHFDALYERGRWVEPGVARNDTLISKVRKEIGRESLPIRIYERLKREPLPDVRDFTIVEKAGPKAMLVFERKSREALTNGVSAFYTKDGYHKHFAQRVDRVAAELTEEETWVLGAGSALAAGAMAAPKVVAEAVKRLYLEDYRGIWRRFINDITVLHSRDLAKTIDITQVISAQDSPLKPLMKALDRETKLSVPPEGLGGKLDEIKGKAAKAIGAAPPLEKALVDDHFEDVARFVTSPAPGAPAPMDALIGLLNDFYHWLIAAKAALDARSAPPSPDPVNKLRAEASRHAELVRTIALGLAGPGLSQVDTIKQQQQLAEQRQAQEKQAVEQRQAQEKQAVEQRQAQEKQAVEQRQAQEKQAVEQRQAQEKQAVEQRQLREKQVADSRQLRERIDAELRAKVTEFCVRAISGRYPFVRTSAEDVPADDFAQLFAPGGVLDAFFQKHLAAHVDTGQKLWRFKEPSMGQAAWLAEFQRAQVIRDVFFGSKGGTPSIQFEFKPLEMDASIHQFVLDVDGKLVRYAHGPQVPVKVQFPGPAGRGQVRVSISPPPASGSTGMKFDGAWALFRMFDTVQIKETKQWERFVATIVVEGRRAVFEVSAFSVRNPFRLPELGEFRCPTTP